MEISILRQPWKTVMSANEVLHPLLFETKQLMEYRRIYDQSAVWACTELEDPRVAM